MINADFEKFIRAAELSSSWRYSPLYFEVPYVDLGFTGATRLANEEQVRILNFAPLANGYCAALICTVYRHPARRHPSRLVRRG